MLCQFLENRANAAFEMVVKLRNKIKLRKGPWKDVGRRFTLYQRLLAAEKAWGQSDSLAEDIKTLRTWLEGDILSAIGPSYDERKELLQFVIEQLSFRESSCQDKIKSVCTYLQNQSEELLKFMQTIEVYFSETALEFEVPLPAVVEMYQLKSIFIPTQEKWERYGTQGLLIKNT